MRLTLLLATIALTGYATTAINASTKRPAKPTPKPLPKSPAFLNLELDMIAIHELLKSHKIEVQQVPIANALKNTLYEANIVQLKKHVAATIAVLHTAGFGTVTRFDLNHVKLSSDQLARFLFMTYPDFTSTLEKPKNRPIMDCIKLDPSRAIYTLSPYFHKYEGSLVDKTIEKYLRDEGYSREARLQIYESNASDEDIANSIQAMRTSRYLRFRACLHPSMLLRGILSDQNDYEFGDWWCTKDIKKIAPQNINTIAQEHVNAVAEKLTRIHPDSAIHGCIVGEAAGKLNEYYSTLAKQGKNMKEYQEQQQWLKMCNPSQ